MCINSSKKLTLIGILKACVSETMSDQSVSRLDASAVANVVNGVINALGLQPTLSSPRSRALIPITLKIDE